MAVLSIAETPPQQPDAEDNGANSAADQNQLSANLV